MDFCLEGKGKMRVEVRRESFIIHTAYGYTGSALAMAIVQTCRAGLKGTSGT